METNDKNILKIRVQNTNFWVWGERIERNLWNLYLIESGTNHKDIIKVNVTTKAFAIFTNMTLKTPFPYQGK